MTSLYLRLAGPLQSWAGPKVSGNFSPTDEIPTFSGLRGLLAACLGCPRGELPEWLNELHFAVRVDNAGRVWDEFQTIGDRDEDREFARRLYSVIAGKVARGSNLAFIPDAQGITSIVRRTLLSDAEFIVQVQSEKHLEELDQAVSNPKFIPYLGRKAFAPGFPFYLGVGDDLALSEIPRFSKQSIRTAGRRNPDSAEAEENLEPTPQENDAPAVFVYRLDSLRRKERSCVHPQVLDDRQEWLERIGKSLKRRATLPQ